MTKAEARKLARKIAAEAIDHVISAGIALEVTETDEDAEKLETALSRLVRIVEYPRMWAGED